MQKNDDNNRLERIAEIAGFPRRIEKPAQYLPYVEDFVLMDETAIVLEVDEIWDAYHKSLGDFLVELSKKGDVASMSPNLVDEVYGDIRETEKEYYVMVSEWNILSTRKENLVLISIQLRRNCDSWREEIG